MNIRNNQHRTEDYARQVLARAERDGRSIKALAREQGVSPRRLYWWKKRLRDEDARSRSSFVEVSIYGATADAAVRGQMCNGRSVAVWRGFDAATLARLLALVKATEC